MLLEPERRGGSCRWVYGRRSICDGHWVCKFGLIRSFRRVATRNDPVLIEDIKTEGCIPITVSKGEASPLCRYSESRGSSGKCTSGGTTPGMDKKTYAIVSTSRNLEWSHTALFAFMKPSGSRLFAGRFLRIALNQWRLPPYEVNSYVHVSSSISHSRPPAEAGRTLHLRRLRAR